MMVVGESSFDQWVKGKFMITLNFIMNCLLYFMFNILVCMFCRWAPNHCATKELGMQLGHNLGVLTITMTKHQRKSNLNGGLNLR